MGNACMPIRSAGTRANQPPPASGPARMPSGSSQRSSSYAPAAELPISPRRRAAVVAQQGFGDLPDDIQQQVTDLLPRSDRGALRQAGPATHRALPRNERDAMHAMEGAHALLDIGPDTPADEVAMAVRRGVAAAGNKDWQDRGTLLAAARHAVGLLTEHPEQAQLLAHIDAAIRSSGLTSEQWRSVEGIHTMMLHARQFR